MIFSPSPQPLKENQFVIPKSRYDSIDCFLANAEYNDVEVLYDKDLFQELKDGGRWQEGGVRKGGREGDKDGGRWQEWGGGGGREEGAQGWR